MVSRRDLWLALPRQLRTLPADLAVVTIGVLLTLFVVFVPGINDTPLRVIFGLGFVLFLPGYAFVAALFPEASTSQSSTSEVDTTGDDQDSIAPSPQPGTTAAVEEDSSQETVGNSTSDRSGIDGIERVALSFGLSIAIVPLIGLVLNFTPWGIRLTPVTVSVAGFTLVCVAVATQRRRELPDDEQFKVPYRAWLAAGRTEFVEPDSRTDAGLNILLTLSVLLAVSSVGYAVAVPPQGEQFTEFYLLTENADGDLVADNYPQNVVIDEQPEVIVGIENSEYEPTNYTVIVQLQSVTTKGNNTTVQSRTEIDRFTADIGHNETYREPRSLTPTETGENFRVKYLLYRGDAPSTPTEETAYRDLHLYLNVSAA